MSPRFPALVHPCTLLALALGLLASLTGCATSVTAPVAARPADATDPKVTGDAQLVTQPEGVLVLSLEKATGRAEVEFNFPAPFLDLSTYRDLALQVDNRTGVELDILVTGLSDLAVAYQACAQSRFLVRPAEKADLHVLMARPTLPKDHPLVKRLGNLFAFPWGYQRHWQYLDAAAILRVTARVTWAGAKPGQTLTLSRPNGFGSYSVDPALLDTLQLPIVDEFGQDRSQRWPGKVDSVEELRNDGKRDVALVASSTRPRTQHSIYGGAPGAPTRTASGFFRVEKIDGKWWFIDPEGHLFWSLGVNCAATSSNTRVKGRETLFPESVRHREAVDYYRENVKLKHGDAAWEKNHTDVTLARMMDWGLNTLGVWSASELSAARRVPYTLIAHPDLQGIGSIRKMADPFSEGFNNSLNEILADMAAKHGDSPWLIGVFIENELDWKNGSDLAEEVLRCGSWVPARKAFVALLQKRYPDIAALNQAWGANYESFDVLRPRTGATPSPAYAKDLYDFMVLFADTFYGACAAAMDRHLPNHLYLGSRLHGWNPIIMAANSRHCDVISVNAYRYTLDDFSLTTDVDKPYLIGEFHFGTRDHGVWGAGLTWAADSRNQSDVVQAYLSDALRHPNIIGAHWFQWSGQAVTGRFDGENFGVGLVTIVDRPVEPLVDASRNVADALFEYRLAPTPARIGAPAPR